MPINYETDLLKHYVRTDGWLPACKRRFDQIHSSTRPRRLKYFTFCAVDAVDVLMLDVEGIIRRSTSDKFDTVVYFDRDEEAVFRTEKRIPGAIGFPGNFIEVVGGAGQDQDVDPNGVSLLEAPSDKPDEEGTRRDQRLREQRRLFLAHFPFDVINLDLEGFFFRPREQLPGRVVKSFRQLLAWQKKSMNPKYGAPKPIDAFSLMFTTQIGPPDAPVDFQNMLSTVLRDNIRVDPQLSSPLRERAGTDDVATIMQADFELFFKLAMPKVLTAAIYESDWYVDPEWGIRMYQFQREAKDGPYQMLHLVMDVRRRDPPQQNRGPQPPWIVDSELVTGHRAVVRSLFETRETTVTHDNIDAVKLSKSLEQIRIRRRKYCPDDD